jgi:SAM-dependent methyltransferase
VIRGLPYLATNPVMRRIGRRVPPRWRRLPVRWGSFRRLTPVSRVFGFDRGVSIDRYYIEAFLVLHEGDICGHVLEVANRTYTRRFGADRVSRSDVLHAVDGNPNATIVGDLATGQGIPVEAFDCLILTQTLPFIYDVRGAIAHSFRALKPGGVLLATFPGISQISRYDMDRWGEYWRFTDLSARLLFEEVFPAADVTVRTHGNVQAAVGFLHGLAAHELKRHELDFTDPDYQVSITVRAVRPV